MAERSKRHLWGILFVLTGVLVVALSVETWAMVRTRHRLDSLSPGHEATAWARSASSDNSFVKAVQDRLGRAGDGKQASIHDAFVEPFDYVAGGPWQVTWDPWREMRRIRDEAEALSSYFFNPLGYVPFVSSVDVPDWFIPTIDLKEEADRYVVRADVPGATQDDVDVSVNDDRVTISGTRSSEDEEKGPDGTTLWRERRMGHFERTVALPGPVDASRMSIATQDGVVEITLPKAAAQSS